MAALLVCLSISTGHSPVLTEWLRMCGNVQLGSVFFNFLFCPFFFFFFFLFMFCTDRTETLERVAVPFTFDWDFKEPRCGAIQITGKIWTRHKQMFHSPRVCPGASILKKKKIIMWMCFRWGKKKKKKGLFHVVSLRMRFSSVSS